MDSLEGIAASLNFALASSALPIHGLHAVRRYIGNGARILIQRGCPAGSGDPLLDTVEQLFKSHYDLTWSSGTFAYNGIIELLESLQDRGCPLAVLSNKPHRFTETIVSQLFPGIRFASVLGQRTGVPHKPDPTGALEISKIFNRKPENCIVIGDSVMDLETASNAGMHAIAVMWGFHDRDRLVEAGAKRIAANPKQLLELLS